MSAAVSPDDVSCVSEAQESANRESRARVALVVAISCFLGALLAAYFALRAPSSGLPAALLGLGSMLMFLAAPIAAGVFAASFSLSDSVVARVLIGLATALVVLLVLFFAWIKLYLASGGRIHM
jgi:disulfide bond formation protein DsbB